MTLDTRDLHRLFAQIVDIESVSRNEERLADAVQAVLEPCGHLEVTRHGNSVVARTHLGRAQRMIIAGHLDTVPVADNLPSRLEHRPDGDYLVGRGTADMKGGIAVMVQLATQLAEPVHDVTWVFYECEEIEAAANGLTKIAAAQPQWLAGDFAVLMEPTSARIEGGCQGTTRFLLITHGVAAHSARSWLGHNAIHDLTPLLQRIQAFPVRRVMVEGLEYREGLNATIVSGGVAGNMIPDRAQLQVNYRFAPDLDADRALARMRELFDLPDVDFEVLDLSPAARPGLDRPEARGFLQAVGGTPGPKYGWTDVARFGQLGIPAVNYGPADAGKAHAVDECCPLADLDTCAGALTTWLTNRAPDR
ncbi:succinyl-diaminopimelate desuccinylase [Propionibacterium freudenreichii]|uniref:succinyl-diaminopimelate desuccinylase n=1 Tax=Propionibacterium freudenreichii TaxID=1744 RepID=UPI0005A5CCDA|nr:succinyl-diaminopimelate desuccinylase [Propionibacterium freudenreichii]MCT2981227.1 succinyl-diaminopimelate desuccinylase [Propionibacterium freudenreichii]CEI32087.1 Succinyl-diaminopimelate desuccinylase / Acetylornithine deacetylase [Propionibacterium freudenreichii]